MQGTHFMALYISLGLLLLLFPTFLIAEEKYYIEIGKYSAEIEAENVIKELEEKGLSCKVKESIVALKQFRVICGAYKTSEEAETFKDMVSLVFDYKKASVFSVKDEPPGSERITGKIFGKKAKYIHPTLSMTGYLTDNVFNTNNESEDDQVSVISPGVWISVPGAMERLLRLDTETLSPGGVTKGALELGKRYLPRRYQAYLLYRTDIEAFAQNSSQDFNNHRVEGTFQYNFANGLSVTVIDQFLRSHDSRGTGISTSLEKFNTNLFNFITEYQLSPKTKLRASYSNFLVDYNGERNEYRNRTDNSGTLYAIYKLTAKMSPFIGYEYLDMGYDEDILPESQEHHAFAGLQWNFTAKTAGLIKLGYGLKDFSDSNAATNESIDNGNDLLAEMTLNHAFTSKTSAFLSYSRKTRETNITTTDYMMSDLLTAGYHQKLTRKLSATARFSYGKDKYEEHNLEFEGDREERIDDYLRGDAALQYQIFRWLSAEAGYRYTRRDSTFSEWDYTTNVGFIKFDTSL
jgi:hypothetical protein